MRPLPAILLGALGGAILATGLGWGVGAGSTAAPILIPPAAGSTPPSVVDGHRDLAEGLARVETELARLGAEITALRTARERLGTRTSLAGASGSDIDEVALADALRRAEKEREAQRLASLTDPQLLAEARRQAKLDPLRGQDLLEELLARPLSTTHRSQALTHLGLLHRKADDLARAEEVLLRAVTLGAGTDDGAWASYELAMTLRAGGDPARALGIVAPVAAVPGISSWNRLHAEWATATLEAELGHVDAARARFERVRAECEGTELDPLARRVTGQLEALR